MLDIFLMRTEKIERAEHTDAAKTTELISSTKGTVWIRCTTPTQEDILALAEITKIPEDRLRGALEENERSKATVDKHIEIIYTEPVMDGDEIITSPLYIYAFGNTIVTIERKPTSILNQLSSALLDNKRKFLFKKPGGYFIFYVLDKINGEFLYFIDKISIKIDLFRDKKETLSKKSIDKIYDTSITLSYFNQALIANIEVLNELRKSYYKMFEQEDRGHFTELYYDALQILDTEKIQREVLSNLLNIHSIVTSSELNNFMKVVAFVALLSTLPNIITSIFSMNIKHSPIVESPYAFWILLGIIIGGSALSYLIFKLIEKKWK